MALGERRVLEPDPWSQRPPPPPPPNPPTREPRALPIPWVSGAVIGVCVLATVADTLTGHAFIQQGELYGPAVQSGQWYRALTTIALHGGFLHLFFNMSVVWTVGIQLERAIGSARFAAISLVTAIGSSSLALLFSFHIPTVGASGMILGWVGALLPIASRQGRRQIGTWLIQIVVISLLPGVSWQGHLGGFLFGLPCGALLRNRARYFAYGIPVVLVLAIVLLYFAGNSGGIGGR